MNPKQEIEQLTRELEYHNRQYYVLDDPKIDDYTYDHMLRRLEDLEKEYPQYASPTSPTRRVGGEAISAFQKVQHAVPLESLQIGGVTIFLFVLIIAASEDLGVALQYIFIFATMW